MASYAQKVIEHAPFEETLETQTLVLRNLGRDAKYSACVSKGVDILRQLGFDITMSPTKESGKNAMAATNAAASQYDVHRILSLCDQPLGDSVHPIIKIMEAIHRSAYLLSSPIREYFAACIPP